MTKLVLKFPEWSVERVKCPTKQEGDNGQKDVLCYDNMIMKIYIRYKIKYIRIQQHNILQHKTT